MASIEPLRAPTHEGEETCLYVANARAQRSFNTVLDASALFLQNGRSRVVTKLAGSGPERRITIATEHALKGGSVSEEFTLTAHERLAPLSLHRRLPDETGTASRDERVDFTRGPLKLPDATYPEVMLPFVLRWQPMDGTRRSFLAWIADRFVAKVYFEVQRKTVKLNVPAGSIEAHEAVMYPDLNDWVRLGAVLETLAKPLLPKYRMWFEVAKPNRVVRFEGPYGPPGAPEIVLELAG